MPSTVIEKWNYNEENKTLLIVYRSGVVYKYLDVPVDVYDAFLSAFSKGIFLNRVIKKEYEFVKVQ